MSIMKKTLFVIALFILVASVSLVAADGGYFPRPGYWVRPGEQKAIIFHENNAETLIVSSSFQGNAKDLVWIIPTPTKPEITKASEEVFTNVAKLARVQKDYGYGYKAVMEAAGSAQTLGVVVIESKKVDYYDVKVLVATNSQDLVTWFNENNYEYPEEYGYVLDYYISKGWFFTAIKVSPEAQGATEVIQDFREGHATPVKLTFLTDKIVYPLKISSVDFDPVKILKAASEEPINSIRVIRGQFWTKIGINHWQGDARYYTGTQSFTDDYIDSQPGGINYNYNYRYGANTPIYIYLISDGKYEESNFNVQYGNWVKKDEIEKLGKDESGKPLIQAKGGKYYLTYLSANMQKSQMDNDIYFEKADNNKKVNAGPETWQLFLYGLIIGFLIFTLWIFTPIGILFIIGIIVLFAAKSQGARIFGWIATMFSLIISFLIATIFIIIASLNTQWNYVITSVFVTSLLLILIMLLLIFIQAKYKRK